MKKKVLIAAGLRDIFIATPGRVLFEMDYSQLEARIIALLSGDQKLLYWFNNDIDIHRETAALLFGVPPKEVTTQQREMAKRARYAVHYGSKEENAWRALHVDYGGLALSDVKRMWRVFKKEHRKLILYQQEQLRKARIKGYIEGPLSGRRHHFHGLVEPASVYNLPIQITAADIIDAALDRINARMDWTKDAVMCQVHDSLLGESERPKWFWPIMKEEMEREVELGGNRIKFEVDVKVGTCWGTAKECKTEQAINDEIDLLMAA